LVLAETLRAKVIAVDLHQPFLDQLDTAARDRGLSHLIETRQGDMSALAVEPGTIDLIWSEGAIYILGFGDGLRLWRPLLALHGLAAVSECSWLTEDHPAAAEEFWREAYPTMGSIEENSATARAAGFAVLDTFTLPPSAWWDDYYTPLLARAEQLRPTADDELKAVIEETKREIDLYRKYGESFGYVFYLLKKAD
jgi:serine/threonine-protein kinase HipA